MAVVTLRSVMEPLKGLPAAEQAYDKAKGQADARETELVLDAILALAVGSAPTTSVPKGPR